MRRSLVLSGYFLKAARSELCCAVDWRGWIQKAAEVVTDDLGWSIVPVDGTDDLRIARQSLDHGVSHVVVEGGVEGRTYMLSGRVGTTASRQIDRSIVVRIKEIEAVA